MSGPNPVFEDAEGWGSFVADTLRSVGKDMRGQEVVEEDVEEHVSEPQIAVPQSLSHSNVSLPSCEADERNSCYEPRRSELQLGPIGRSRS